MQINVDVDGVVADTIPSLFAQLAAKGFELEPLDDPRWRTWNVVKILPDEARKEALDMWKTEEFWYNLPVVEGAKESIELLREGGHHIQWVTSPWKSCRGWWSARRDWLDKHFKHSNQDLEKDYTVTGNKTNIWADLFIDDKPQTVNDWSIKWRNGDARLFKTRHNYRHHQYFTLFEWTDIPSILV